MVHATEPGHACVPCCLPLCPEVTHAPALQNPQHFSFAQKFKVAGEAFLVPPRLDVAVHYNVLRYAMICHPPMSAWALRVFRDGMHGSSPKPTVCHTPPASFMQCVAQAATGPHELSICLLPSALPSVTRTSQPKRDKSWETPPLALSG